MIREKMFNGEEDRAFYSEEKRRKRSVVYLTNRAEDNQIEVRDYREDMPGEEGAAEEAKELLLSRAWEMMTPSDMTVECLRLMGGKPSYRPTLGAPANKTEIVHLALVSLSKPSHSREILEEIGRMGLPWNRTEKQTRSILWIGNRFLPLGKGIFMPDPRWYDSYGDENDAHMIEFVMKHCAKPMTLRGYSEDGNPENDADPVVGRRVEVRHRGWGPVEPRACAICGEVWQPTRKRRGKLCGKAACLKENGRRAAMRRWPPKPASV